MLSIYAWTEISTAAIRISVMPLKAGIQVFQYVNDSGFRRGDAPTLAPPDRFSLIHKH